MAEITKQALKVDNNQSFPNNNNGAITPSILRAFNVNMIDSLVDEVGYTADSASWNQQIDALEQFTASASGLSTGSLLVTASFDNGTRNLTFTKGNNTQFAVNIPDASGSATINTGSFVTTSSFNAYTQSNDQRVSSLESTSASLLIETQNLELFSASALISIANLNSATSSYVTETESGSFLLTASFDNGTRNLTFTKGNNTTFNVNIPDVSGSAGNFVTTSSFNQYTASTDSSISQLNQSSASQQVSIDNLNTTTASLLVETQNLESFSASALISLSNLNQATASLFTSASLGLTTASVSGQIMTFRKGDGTTFDVTLPAGGSGSVVDTGSLVTTASFNAYTQSTDSRLTNIETTTASLLVETQNLELFTASQALLNTTFATTGSNVFTGDQTFIDNGSNFFTITDASGSLMLVGKSNTSSSLHISQSVVTAGSGAVNLIFKVNNNTADTIISGSNNIFQNPAAPTAGFKRYLSSNNIALGAGFPQISGSMQYSPTISGNYFGQSAVTMRGPVSASLQTISGNNLLAGVNIGQNATLHAERLTGVVNVTTNYINGGLNVIANQSEIRSNTSISGNNLNGTAFLNLSSSAVSFNTNTINDNGFTFLNQFSSGAIGFGAPTVNNNIIGGTSNIFYVTGSQLGAGAAPILNQNLVAGAFNTVFVDASTARVSGANIYQNVFATSLLGQRLIVTGSSNITDSNSFGSTFIGRWNAVDGVRDKTSDIVFAVGTGTSTTRKTGFHITSGSNSFFEGTVSISGSLLVNGIAPAAVDTGSFATTGSNAFNGNQTISGSVSIRGNTTFTSFSGDQSSVILGSEALGDSSGGSINVAIGNQAMKFASGSNQNVAIGNRALFKATGSFNIAIGSETLTENTTGNNNVAIGLNALNVSTTAAENFALGSNSMMFTSASNANFNVGIGANTLSRNQTDSQIAIGSNALQNVTTGNANTAIGRLSMQNTTTGFDNIAVGANTLLSNTTGERNIAIGKESLRNAAVNASYNVAIGDSTLYNAKSSRSTGVGYAAFNQLQSGSQNTGIGYLAGYNVTTGNNNTLIGAELRGQSNWDSVIAISNGLGDTAIKFFNSGSRTTLTNDTLISGSLTTTGSLTIQSGSSFFANGTKQFNVGAFQSNVAQSGSAGVSQSMNFEVTDYSEGVTMVSNNRITLANAGFYNIQFSIQLLASTGADDVWIWLKKNGTNIAATAGHIVLANNEESVASWNYVIQAAAGDYFELAWQNQNGIAILLTEAASGNIPSVPSTILTVTQVR